jgi:hypothetical protein
MRTLRDEMEECIRDLFMWHGTAYNGSITLLTDEVFKTLLIDEDTQARPYDEYVVSRKLHLAQVEKGLSHEREEMEGEGDNG